MSPLTEPIHGFVPFTNARVLTIRATRETHWAALTAAEQPKVKKPRVAKSSASITLPTNVPADQQALVLETLRKMGLA